MDDKKREDYEGFKDFEELRRLIMGGELEELEALRARFGTRARFEQEVVDILPQAVTDSSSQSEELSAAMVPTVEEIVRLSIKKDINKFADALFPVIGPAIRKSIKEAFRQMLQSLNQTLEQSLSWQGFKWRLESMRTGIPIAQIALLHGLVYRVEQVFLIHRETGLLLCHLGGEPGQEQNADLVSSMLSAINDFVSDSFEIEENRSLNSIEVGELSIWIEPGPNATLALAIRGEAPIGLRESMQQTLEQIQAQLEDELVAFGGDTGPFEERDELLGDCMQAQYQVRKKGSSATTLIVGLLLLGLVLYWIVVTVEQSRQRSAYVTSLQQEAGYVITGSSHEDGKLIVSGLRDPLARPPAALLAESSFGAGEVEHRLTPYQSLEAALVERRARRILTPPEGVVVGLVDRRLQVSGVADLAWRQQLDRRLPLIAGIDGIDDSGFRLRFEPVLLQPPPGVALQLEDGVLYVEGAAEHDWIAGLDSVTRRFPEVDAVDARAVVNLTEVALVKDIQALEKEAVFFDVATSFEFNHIDTPRITGLVKKIIAGGNKLSRNVLITVRGFSDSVGSFEDNKFLSMERADYVAQALFNTGIGPRYIAIKGLEQPVKPESSPAERRFNRRVGFEVIVE